MKKFKKNLKIIGFTVLIILEIEIALNVVSWCFKEYINYKNLQFESNTDKKILVVGDSISSDTMYLIDRPWPRILEEELSDTKIRFKIFNESYPLNTTTSIAHDLPAYLKKYNPDIVIVMSSIVDSNIVWLESQTSSKDMITSFFNKLKIVKIVKIYIQKNRSVIEHPEPSKNTMVAESNLGYKDTKKIAEKIIKTENINLEEKVEVFLKNKSDIEKAQFYAYIAWEVTPSLEGNKKEMRLSLDLIKKSLTYSYHIKHISTALFWLAKKIGDEKSCLWLFERYRIQNKHLTSEEITGITQCLSLKKYPIVNNFLNDQKIFLDEIEQYDNSITKNAFQSIYRQVEKQGACLFAVQYPLMNSEDLKKYFNDEQQKKITFVSNLDNFKKLLEEHNRNEVFADFVNGTWGHGRDLANQTIAKSVMNSILDTINKKRCYNE